MSEDTKSAKVCVLIQSAKPDLTSGAKPEFFSLANKGVAQQTI